MDFFGIGGWEILLILVITLIVLGPGKIPEIARTLGRTIRAIRKASSDLTVAVTRELESAQDVPIPPVKKIPANIGSATTNPEPPANSPPDAGQTRPGGNPPAP